MPIDHSFIVTSNGDIAVSAGQVIRFAHYILRGNTPVNSLA